MEPRRPLFQEIQKNKNNFYPKFPQQTQISVQTTIIAIQYNNTVALK